MKSFLKNAMITTLALIVTVAFLPKIIHLAIVNPEGFKQLPKEIEKALSQI